MPDNQTIIQPVRPQRSMSIKGLIPRLPERGRIKIGIKGEMITSQRGNQFQPPQKLDHFRVTTLERGADGNFLLDTAFHAKYGPEPTEIPVRLLYDDPSLNYPTRYACYIGRSLWCTGDGETATRLTEAPQDLKNPGAISPREVACTCPRAEATYQGTADRCKMNGSLSVLIEGMGGIGGVWKFRTTSYNSIIGILSSMQFLRSVTSGVLANIPLVLRIQPKQATNPQNPAQSVLIYVVSIEYPGEISELQDIAHRIALDRATTHISITHIEAEARRLLELPAPANVVLPGDEPNEIIEEYYPEQVEGAAAPISGDAPPRPTREQFASPQAPEKLKESPPEQAMTEAEQAEFDALLTAGGEAAAQGAEAFTKFWNKKATKAYRKELTPYLTDWSAVTKAADEGVPFEVIDMFGNVIEYPEAEHAIDAYRAAIEEAKGDESALTTVWDNNQGFMRHLDERGLDALSKEMSLEYGKAREAAAAARAVPRGTADDIPPNDYSDEAINEENHRRSEEGPAEPPFAPTATVPEPTGGSSDTTARGQAHSPAGRGPTATTPVSPSEPRDLLGNPPPEDLLVPLMRQPKASDLDYFARQILALIEEQPGNAARRIRIRSANEAGLLALKSGAVERYDEVQRALTRKT